MTRQAAIILGASGSVGKALCDEVVRCGQFSTVMVVVRRSLGLGDGSMVRELVVPNMDPQSLRRSVASALSQLSVDAIGFSALGVGAGTAKLSLEQHRAIDVDLNAAFARGLKESGKVHHLVFMSAVGADINARTTGSGAAGMGRYSRVKGEAEAAVQKEGPAVVSIFRPSTILGSPHTPRLLAAIASLLAPLTPARFRPIRTTEIAQAMVACARRAPAESAIYSYTEMKAFVLG